MRCKGCGKEWRVLISGLCVECTRDEYLGIKRKPHRSLARTCAPARIDRVSVTIPKGTPIRRIMRHDVEGSDAEELLEAAESAFPESDFVGSVWDWFEEHGFVTEKQAEALRRIADKDY